MKFAIAHAAFAPGRAKTLERLVEQLASMGATPHVQVSEQPETCYAWARRLWSWVASQSEPVVCLNDDVELMPNFVRIVEAMNAAIPDEILSLHAQGPVAEALFKDGHRLLRFHDLTGPAYLLTPEIAASLVAFWDENKDLQNVPHLNEDNVASQWMWSVQKPAWAPLPSPVQHDIEVPSTYGPSYDAHKYRQSAVCWKACECDLEAMATPEYWKPGPDVRTIENPWFHSRDLERCRRDRIDPPEPCSMCGGQSKDRIAVRSPATDRTICSSCASKVAAHLESQKPKQLGPNIIIATPRRPGDGCAEYDALLLELSRSPFFNLLGVKAATEDIVRARSRIARQVCAIPTASHLLLIDADVSCSIEAIGGMFRAKRDIVVTPYPKKTVLGFDQGEDRAYSYPIRRLPGQKRDDPWDFDPAGCAEIAGAGIGCTLISRECLVRMTEHYGELETVFPELEFLTQPEALPKDVAGLKSLLQEVYDLGRSRPRIGYVDQADGEYTIGLFGLMCDGEEMLGEDHSFFARWRMMGGKVWMYMGPGSPATHHGAHTYVGNPRAFGVVRGQPQGEGHEEQHANP